MNDQKRLSNEKQFDEWIKMITKKEISEKLLSYLQHRVTLKGLIG